MPTNKNDENSSQDTQAPVDRRAFLGRGAVMAAAAVGAPALLAACDADATAPEARATADGTGPSLACATTHTSTQPWWALHYTVAKTIGSSTYVKVPTLEKGTYGYVQRVITDDSRIGSALATVLKADYKWSNGSATVVVQTSTGKRWSPRSIGSQSDLAYAMKDALVGNTLTYGVLRDSLNKGYPVIPVFKSAIVQYRDSVASDYYGNINKPAHCAFSGIFNSAVSDIAITATIRDPAMC